MQQWGIRYALPLLRGCGVVPVEVHIKLEFSEEADQRKFVGYIDKQTDALTRRLTNC
jgi:hypothetical protein